MKAILTVLAWSIITSAALSAETPAPADEVKVGDPVEIVQLVLGEPRSYMRGGTYEILQYDRGRVELRDGKVTEVQLVSAEEAERIRAVREEQHRQRLAARAVEQERLRTEGLALKERALSDPEFEQMREEDRLAFWTKFRRKFPDVPAELEHAKARAAVESKRELERERERARVMEARVAEAERRAAAAEREADEDRRRRDRYVSYAPPFVDYTPFVAANPYVVPVPTRPTCTHGHTKPIHSRHTTQQGGVRHNYTVDTRRSDLTFQTIERIRSYPKSPSPITSPGFSTLRIPHP